MRSCFTSLCLYYALLCYMMCACACMSVYLHGSLCAWKYAKYVKYVISVIRIFYNLYNFYTPIARGSLVREYDSCSGILMFDTVEGKNIGAPQNSEKHNKIPKNKNSWNNSPKIVQNQYFSTKIDAIDAEKREESKNKIKNNKKHKKTQKKKTPKPKNKIHKKLT